MRQLRACLPQGCLWLLTHKLLPLSPLVSSFAQSCYQLFCHAFDQQLIYILQEFLISTNSHCMPLSCWSPQSQKGVSSSLCSLTFFKMLARVCSAVRPTSPLLFPHRPASHQPSVVLLQNFSTTAKLCNRKLCGESFGHVSLSKRRLRSSVREVSAMASHDIEVFGKAASGTGSPSTVRGDCPFSQRTYMDLEEKGVSYKSTYIQEGPDKPQWFMENNPSGLMPVLRDGQKWVQDSDKIIEYLDEQFPDSPLKGPENLKSVGAGVFQNFTQWLQAKDANRPTKHELEKELQTLDEHLKTKGPYVAGEKFTDLDCALSPKLLHARVSLKHFYGFKFPENLTALKKYMEDVENRQSLKNTSYPDDMIVKGWQMKFELPNTMIPQGQSA